MGPKREACAECAGKCFRIHGKKKISSLSITSFFKVMMGNKYSQILLLPPKFANTVSDLINQEIFLEDSCGKQWKVKISEDGDSLAFKEGWSKFSLHHELEIGDFVVFNQITRSCFVVKIYGRTGCEKFNFSGGSNKKKKARNNGCSTSEYVTRHSVDKGSKNTHDSSTSVVSVPYVDCNQSRSRKQVLGEKETVRECNPSHDGTNIQTRPAFKAECTEEPFCMFSRVLGEKQEEETRTIIDLASFEMPRNGYSTGRSNKVMAGAKSLDDTDVLLGSQYHAELVTEDGGFDQEFGHGTPQSASELEMVKRNIGFQPLRKTAIKAEKDCWNENTTSHCVMDSAKRAREEVGCVFDTSSSFLEDCRIAADGDIMSSGNGPAALKEHTSHIHGCHSAIGGEARVIKKEFMANGSVMGLQQLHVFHHQSSQSGFSKKPSSSSTQDFKPDNAWSRAAIPKEHDSPKVPAECSNQVNAKMKIETDESVNLSSPSATACISSLVGTSQSFLELPTSLPSSFESQVVLLRDPSTHLWPVLYQERYGFKILSSGWEVFRKANNIQPGDECVFRVENESEDIYSVKIVRSPGSLTFHS